MASLSLIVLIAGALALIGLLVLVVKLAPRSATAADLGRGDFERVLERADLGERADREELIAAAVAAKHLLRLDRAEELLRRQLAADPADGEAWLELGLVTAYRDRHPEADEALARAAELRADLLESITLHRAWIALRRGRAGEARRLFEEVEAPLENKLRADLGSGEPLFAEWFQQAAELWRAAGDDERADWARKEALRTAPQSRLLAAARD